MIALVTAGETIFLLPFVFGRLFRPTVLDVFGISNLELGLVYSVYGFVAMGAYFAGGPLADRFSARRLMAVALLATGVGGIGLATVHSLEILWVLYAWWGVTTILLFWAALIRATRQWGGANEQGRAYGILDGGRGLVAALFASGMLALFSVMLPQDAATATLEQRTLALERMIWIVTGFTVVVAVMVLRWVPDGSCAGASGSCALADDSADTRADGDSDSPSDSSSSSPRRRWSVEDVLAVVRLPVVWLQSIIVVCAYVGFKSIDNISLFARDAFGYDDVASAQLGTVTFWVRPFAAVIAGLLADRTRASSMIIVSFVVLIAGNLVLASGVIPIGLSGVLFLTVAVTCLGIYGARGLYFALLGEGRVPMARTGTAVGVVSVIGYTPDVFMGPLMGWLTDRSPGALGHEHVYAMVAAFGVAGLIGTVLFRRAIR